MFILFADGSCLGNPGPGGFAYILRDSHGEERVFSGGEASTTNNRMELQAVIHGLQQLPARTQVRVVTDSQYVIKGMTEWIAGWKARGWKNSKKEPVKNRELWEQLDKVVSERHVSWEWVEGHSGHPENERCDEMARNVAEQFESGQE